MIMGTFRSPATPNYPRSWKGLDSAQQRQVSMHTEVCDRLGMEFPIFAFSHCRDVVAAVTNAGGFGVLGATGHSPRALEIDLAWIDEQVKAKPYGVDLLLPVTYDKTAPQHGDTRRDE